MYILIFQSKLWVSGSTLIYQTNRLQTDVLISILC